MYHMCARVKPCWCKTPIGPNHALLTGEAISAGCRDKCSKSDKSGGAVADFKHAGSGIRRTGWSRGALLWSFLGRQERTVNSFTHMTFAMLSALYRCRSFPQLRDEPFILGAHRALAGNIYARTHTARIRSLSPPDDPFPTRRRFHQTP